MADLNHIYKQMASRREAGLELQQVAPLGNGTFKIIASVSKVTSEAEFSEAIASQTGGRARVVPNTFSMKGRAAIAVVKGNAVSRKMDSSFTTVTKELASDASGQLWSVREVDGNKHVVLESTDDLEALFAQRCNARKSFLSPVETRALSATAAIRNGDLVKYVDTASGVAKGGLAFNVSGQLTVVDTAGVTHHVNGDTVLTVVARESLPGDLSKSVEPFEAKAALAPEKLATILAFLRKSYGEASEEMLSKMAKLAGVGLPAAGVPTF